MCIYIYICVYVYIYIYVIVDTPRSSCMYAPRTSRGSQIRRLELLELATCQLKSGGVLRRRVPEVWAQQLGLEGKCEYIYIYVYIYMYLYI